MAVHSKLMICAGIAIAGLGLIGAGAGATFTAQVSATTQITSGGVGLSLNDKTGSGLNLELDGNKISSHFAPITKDLLLRNTGTLDMASTFLSITATGCDGSKSAPLAKALHVKLTEETQDSGKSHHADNVIFDASLCSFAGSIDGRGFITPRTHPGVGGQLPHTLKAGETITYRLVIQPDDALEGLPSAAQYTSTMVKLEFAGFDF